MSKCRIVEIIATPNAASKEGYDFELKYRGKKVESLDFYKNDDGMKRTDRYKISFILRNKGHESTHLRFSKDLDTVLWAKPVDSDKVACPSTPCGMPRVFFVDRNRPIEDEILTVINTDPSEQLFKFAFNFLRPGDSDGPNTDYAWFDPIASNRNGGVRAPVAKEFILGLVGLVIGALLGAFVIAPLFL